MIFFDTEVGVKSNKIQDIGAITRLGNEFHNSSISEFRIFIDDKQPRFFVGHNVIYFDLQYLKNTEIGTYLHRDNIIDTLYLSALIFVGNPYHHLVKDDKLHQESNNNPLNDAKKARNLFEDILNEFKKLPYHLKDIFFHLLKQNQYFIGFFRFLGYTPNSNDIVKLIKTHFRHDICCSRNLQALIQNYPVELAYALSYISSGDTRHSLLPPWLLRTFGKVENVLTYLRSDPCANPECRYCQSELNMTDNLHKYFGFSAFREFGGKPIQEEAVRAALCNKSLLAVFPTGGGKSLTFQLPALMSGEKLAGLTVVISPLQSLMKDQVDNLAKKGITNAAYINGLLMPYERKEVIDRVNDGTINLLYIAPESLRSKSIERLLLKRQIVRFVVDEAHCFSTWSHDFRVDYLYIGKFIRNIVRIKELGVPIPVSCFTATAKKDVIADIQNYFRRTLDLDMELIVTTTGRTNLSYKLIKVVDDRERYLELRNLIDSDPRPTIVYASRQKVIEELCKSLNNDNIKATQFHGGMAVEDKTNNQDLFMSGEVNVMVATNAFGMGIDKDNIGVVIHYHIPDSLENYIQEAGRAGRNLDMHANCYILYNADDLNRHFSLLNQSKITRGEINQVWSAVKDLTRYDEQITRSGLELSRAAGWPEELYDKETRMYTSVASLEDANLLERGLNSPRVFATSLLVKSTIEARKILESRGTFSSEELEIAVLIVQKLVGTKWKSRTDEGAESRVDYLADQFGRPRHEIIRVINLLKEAGILADEQDMYARIVTSTTLTVLMTNVNRFYAFFDYLLNTFTTDLRTYHLKELSEKFDHPNYKPNIKTLRSALNYLALKKYIIHEKNSKNYFKASLISDGEKEKAIIKDDFAIAEFIVSYLFNKYSHKDNLIKERGLVAFSSVELAREYQVSLGLIKDKTDFSDMERVILSLHQLGVINFESGFFVTYSPMTIRRINKDSKSRYLDAHYRKLANFYHTRTQLIHIVGAYADLLFESSEKANDFVSDYFNMAYSGFIDKHFPGALKKELDLKISKQSHEKLFAKLSPEQRLIIDDQTSREIGVIAGPGSGKTTLLVHKLASIIYNEDVRADQLLMLTFSRKAALNFKESLVRLIGEFANYITITTFHSYAFDLLGRPGTVAGSGEVIKEATSLILNDEVDKPKVTKTMLVIDEAQDMSEDEYNLIQAIVDKNEDIRLIAVGDDDQNIYKFRGSDSKYLAKMSDNKKYELSLNFRSKINIVNFSNHIAQKLGKRLKTKEIISNNREDGHIEIVKYNHNNLIVPLINDINNRKLSGNTAIITRLNEEALLVSGTLTRQGVENRLIQDFGAVTPFQLYELRSFYDELARVTETKIDQSIWDEVYEKFVERFAASPMLQKCEETLDKFINGYKDPYISDLKEFLIDGELYMKDSALVVANMHKVKGLEFDNVFLLYDNQNDKLSDEELRALYVALTRSKTNLFIHTNNHIFDAYNIVNYLKRKDENTYDQPEYIDVIFGYRDINLWYADILNNRVSRLSTGDEIYYEPTEIGESGLRGVLYQSKKFGSNNRIAVLSQTAFNKMNEYVQQGKEITKVTINNLVYWWDKDKKEESLILLPRFVLKQQIIKNDQE